MSESETKVKPFTPQEYRAEIVKLENLVNDLMWSDRVPSWINGAATYDQIATTRDFMTLARNALTNAALALSRLGEIEDDNSPSWSDDNHVNHYDGQREVNITDLADETEHAAHWEVG